MAGAYGPWASGYGYPPDPTPQQAPAPAPPPPGPAAGGPPPGPTPQPPTVPQPQAGGQDPTLNDVTAAAQPQIDVAQRFQQYRALMEQANAGAQRPHLPESTKPGLLANILSFGMAGLMDRDYRMAYNGAIDAHNSKLSQQNAKDALTMVGQDVHQANGDLGQQIRLLQLQQQIMNNKLLQHHREVIENQGGERNDIARGRANVGAAVRAPKSEAERAAYGDQGLEWRQDPDLPQGIGHLYPVGSRQPSGAPSSTNLERDANGNWVRPGGRTLDPNSPIGRSLGGDQPTANPPPTGNANPPPPPTGKPPGPGEPGGPPLTSDVLRNKVATQKGEEERQKQQMTTLDEVKRNADSVRNYLDDPAFDKAVNALLPSGKGNPIIVGSKRAANVAGTTIKNWGGDENSAYLQRAESNIIEAIRSLSAGSKGMRITIPEIAIFGKQWQQLAHGQMTREEALQFKKQFKVRLDQVQRALNAQPQPGTPSTTETPISTPTTSSTQGTTRTLSSGRTITVEP
jgi:hypothetical protein